jgi:Tol biopolymer transport system component
LIGAVLLAATAALVWFTIHRWNAEPPPESRSLTVTALSGHSGREGHASFSPGGARVVFALDRDGKGGTDLYVATVGELVPRRLTSDTGDHTAPIWSPDGLRIAYLHNSRDLMLISPNGGASRKVAEADGSYLAWSPDSGSVLFGRFASGAMADLWSVSIDTGESRRLTVPTPQVDSSLPFAYSPGGRWFVFAKRANSESGAVLCMAASEGGEVRPLTAPLSGLAGWTWLTDREIVFSAARGERHELFRIPANGAVAPLIPLEGVAADATEPTVAWTAIAAGIESRPLLAYRNDRGKIMIVDGIRNQR